MSALLAHAKAFRALGVAYTERAPFATDRKSFEEESIVYHLAANILEQQARDEASGNKPRDMADAPAADGRPE